MTSGGVHHGLLLLFRVHPGRLHVLSGVWSTAIGLSRWSPKPQPFPRDATPRHGGASARPSDAGDAPSGPASTGFSTAGFAAAVLSASRNASARIPPARDASAGIPTSRDASATIPASGRDAPSRDATARLPATRGAPSGCSTPRDAPAAGPRRERDACSSVEQVGHASGTFGPDPRQRRQRRWGRRQHR